GSQGFHDVAAKAGIAEFGYGQGVAVGDYDNDGFDDVYITNVGANTFWKNLGDGTFKEIGASTGVNDDRWSTSAAWADLDRDGDLDLYVCNYLQYDPMHPLDCRTQKGESRICHPKDVEAWPDECYMNQGDGTFLPEAKSRGLFGDGNKALGVAVADFNNDEWPDIYVANDTTANFLFVNQGDGHFKEEAYLLGCAVDRNGSFQASMGLGVADIDDNGFLDIYSTHFYEESNTLYQNLGAQGFHDMTGLAGLHNMTMPYLGFGVAIDDFDQNGLPDIFVTNGHIENFPGNPLRKMHPQLISFDGRDWRDDGAAAGDYFAGKYVGRGVAACDLDADGDVDLAIVHQNDPMAVLRNDSQRGHWLKFQFRGRASNRRGIGCRVTVRCGGAELMQELCGGTSYDSTNQPALVFGLGDRDAACDVDIHWPSGRRQHLQHVAVDREIVLDEPQ
ncbi:MAG: CRTAC1 family protein, partial [Planctomycetota bacterium]